MEVCDAARGREAVLARGTGGQMPRAACRARRRALAVQRWVGNSAPRSLGVCIWRARGVSAWAPAERGREIRWVAVRGHRAVREGRAGGVVVPRLTMPSDVCVAERQTQIDHGFLVLVLSRNSCERLRIGGGICRARLSRRAPAPPDGARRRAGPRAAGRAGGATATQFTVLVCPASATTSLENFRALIALRAATLTTWHVGAVRAMWCASVRRTTMCWTTSAGKSVSSIGA